MYAASVLRITGTFWSEYEYKTGYEYDSQFHISHIPRTLAPSRCLSADKETLETRLVRQAVA